MEINLNEIRSNSLVRYGFRVLLAKEFGLYLKEQEVEKILLAESCIEIYENVEEFLEKSGWRRVKATKRRNSGTEQTGTNPA